MISAQDVFMTAMELMEEESEDGTFDGYPSEYKNRAWRFLTLLQSELLPASVTPSTITDPNSVFQVDDRTALNVLPYGLAAHLLLSEDQNRAAFFNARYDELKRKRPTAITKIKDVYGIVPQEEESTKPSTDGGSFDYDALGTWDGGEF